MLESLYQLIVNDIYFTIVCIISLLVLGFAFNETSYRCVNSYIIGHNRDKKADFFSGLSVLSYLMAVSVVFIVCLGFIGNSPAIRSSDYSSGTYLSIIETRAEQTMSRSEVQYAVTTVPGIVDEAMNEFLETLNEIQKDL